MTVTSRTYWQTLLVVTSEVCRKCEVEKDESEFPPRAGLGLRRLPRSCATCVRESSRDACKRYRQAHPGGHRRFDPSRARKSTTTGGHYVGESLNGKTLTAYAGRNTYGHHLWKWECDSCNTEYGPSALSHTRRSNRCRECAFSRENNARWLGHEQISGSYLYQCREGASSRGYAWSVTPEELWKVWLSQDGLCTFTGWRLHHDVDASLDRIDSTQGYTVDNVQWVHKDVNRMKNNFTDEYFIAVCRAIAANTPAQE